MIVAPALVISVVLVAVIVRVQPSSVSSDRFEPLIAGDRDRSEAAPDPPEFARQWPGPPMAFGSPLADGVVGVVVDPDGDGDAPMAATAPTRTSAAVPVTIPTRTRGAGRRGSGGTRRRSGGWTGASGTMCSGSVIRVSWCGRVAVGSRSGTRYDRCVAIDPSRVLRTADVPPREDRSADPAVGGGAARWSADRDGRVRREEAQSDQPSRATLAVVAETHLRIRGVPADVSSAR